ncbi:hypothetical protein [Pedosphaera parvula]|uniref:Uncharacterized protein n=1 Tax=Pedosphaera parvula (strain Ellin514) TaxID=320771 RepID=B9XGJ3_PEDPL|nr:hypothetical protein [Pedosphaera parvula]EEF61044.1 hypothetical protein Cflav_PD3761 [Pedosphaera parvula Ellin514]
MARKLYIFNPTGRQRANWNSNAPIKVLGGYSTNYTLLGDQYAKILGVGHQFDSRVKPWALNFAAVAKPVKGGASRLDRNFRGWG